MRRGSARRRWLTAPSWMPVLMVGLVVALVLPLPAVFAVASSTLPQAPFAGSPPTEEEPSEQPGFGTLRVGRERPSRPSRVVTLAPGPFGPVPVARRALLTLRAGHQPGGSDHGHFLDDGRSLRHWLQSQTC